MKGYSTTVLNALRMAQQQGNGNIYPDDIKRLSEFATSPRTTREGYLGKLANDGLLTHPDDKAVSMRHTLTPKGAWVVQMYAGGWSYADEQWTRATDNLTIDDVTAQELQSMGIVPDDHTQTKREDLHRR